MESIPCTIRHLTLIEVSNGIRYTGKVNWEGVELEEVQGVADEGAPERTYFCGNCMKTFDGSETFEIVKSHLGTFPLTD